MLKVYIPDNNIKEREYILETILSDFLGLEYSVSICESQSSWSIEVDNGNRLIIEDHFFNQFPEDLTYLKKENIAKNVAFVKNSFSPLNDIVVIYGNSCEQQSVKNNQLTLAIDIFASAFFMLTRWEEHVIEKKDNHGRFLESEALAIKYDFIDRAVVNEYLVLLVNMLNELGFKDEIKKREYKITITHDIDEDLLYKKPINLARRVASSIIKRKDIKLAFDEIKSYIKGNDPYDTFDFLMTQSERIGEKSNFFFMAKGLTEFDNNYKSNSKFILKQIEKIKKREHNIGIHYTYNAYNNKEQLEKEKIELEKYFNCKIDSGRAHFLRFEVPTTWAILDELGMDFDSSMGYQGYIGFRCGVCYEFSPFEILNRKKLTIKEKPLNVMEVTLMYYQNKDIDTKIILNYINKIKETIKGYNGEFVLLWHNSCLDFIREPEFEKLYIEAIK